jgi:hypothetical protein
MHGPGLFCINTCSLDKKTVSWQKEMEGMKRKIPEAQTVVAGIWTFVAFCWGWSGLEGGGNGA